MALVHHHQLANSSLPGRWSLLFVILVMNGALGVSRAFTTRPTFTVVLHSRTTGMLQPEFLSDENDDDDDDDDEDDTNDSTYRQIASSEFIDEPGTGNRNRIIPTDDPSPTTSIDWGGALGKLRQRVNDVESGKSQDPRQVLFRLMSSQSPNQVIGNFINSANPQVVQAMSGTVSALLGGLSNPMANFETVVKATGDKVASLCFQLQMTGYLFRNAEYVMALKDLMDLRGSASLTDYKEAFDRLDRDRSGFIEASEIEHLLSDLYDGKTPDFEIKAFMNLFDQNKDGKISWEEFQRGLIGLIKNGNAQGQNKRSLALLAGAVDDDDLSIMEPHISGTIEIELEDGKVVQVDADEYVRTLKAEAEALKKALQREKGESLDGKEGVITGIDDPTGAGAFGGIATYIASRQGDVKALTEGISPEIVETMKMLVDFVLEGGESAKAKGIPKEQMEMQIPGSALQQLALWQLILGYRLREAEAKGDYLKLLE